MTSEPVRVVEVFFSYAHKDEKLRNELEKHLAILKRQGCITTWHNRKIAPGKEWDYEINKYLDKAHIILLLISSDFLASDYCDSVEVKQALQRHQKGECRVIPIILRPVSWRDSAFKHLRALPTDDRPVTDWPNRDRAFVNIAEGIKTVVQEISESSITEATETIIENVPIMPILTAQRVIDAWSNIIKRTKQKSSMLAAYMNYYKVLGVEGTSEQPVVVIQTEKSAHYKYVRDENRSKDLEWALDMEFGLPCSIRLVPPGSVSQEQGVISVKKETAAEDNNKTILTVQKVTEVWESIRTRTKQKSSMLAAYLLYFKVIDVEGPAWRPVIIIQAEKPAYYKYVSSENRYKDLEWSLEEEFGVPCEVRLVKPGVSVVQDF